MVRRAKNTKDGVIIGDAIHVEELYSVRPRITRIVLDDNLRTTHMLVFGTTGCGKTRLLEHMVDYDIRQGKNIVIIDPKGDEDLLKRVIATAREVGRIDEVLFTSPVYPHLSVRFNPLAHYIRPEEIVQHIIACLPISAKEPFFAEVAKETAHTVVFSMYYLYGKQDKKFTPTIADLHRLTTYDEIQKIIGLLDQHKGDPEAEGWRGRLSAIVGGAKEYFTKITSTLRTTLAQLSLGSIGEVIASVRENEILERFEAGERCILVVWTGALMFRDPALSLSRLIVSMIQALVGRLYAKQRKFSPPLMLYVDEASNVFYDGIEDMFNKARGAGVAIHAFTQSVSDIDARIGEEKARVILDNANTKIFFKVNDPQTSAYVASVVGEVQSATPMYSADGDLRLTARESKALIEEADAIRLKPRQFFCVVKHEAFRGRTVDVRPAKLRLIFPGLSGGNSGVYMDR